MTDIVKSEDKKERKASENSDVSAEGDVDPIFEPIISLPEVKVTTNEENEETVLKLRAKLYRFDTSGTDGPEWKERGTGELKLLQHRDNNTVRIVMRRDKTLKVCANHFITPWMELKPSTGSDKAFVYTVLADFADEVPKTECLAIRFGSVDFANQFKAKFNESKEFVKTKCSLYAEEAEEYQKDSDIEEKEEDEEDEEKEDDTKDVTKKLEDLNVSKEDSAGDKE
ncbi:ran-specific GTPase-activating protein-like [Agrilus planipennis]|uniref:Ran-specific GTPase-activating protein n=1 Tax=Agrilus planipennis TaxID=224129 RepID=A0A1W4WCG8_AGRPL|nr:ran-specific GTPase-activating protein-like [Agrilus planipennis]